MANPVSLSELSTALDELILRDAIQPLAANDVTAVRVAEKKKCTHQTAMNVIKRWEAQGLVKYVGERMDENSHRCRTWQIVAKGS